MVINVEGKKIEIAEKNAKGYKQIYGVDFDISAINIYLAAFYRHSVDVSYILKNTDEATLSQIVNKMAETEIKDCCGDQFYEGL